MLTPSPLMTRTSPVASSYHQLASAYSSPILNPTATGVLTHVADTLYIFPFFVPQALALTDVGTVCVVGASSAVNRMAIFGWDQTAKEVDSLVADLGTGVDSEVADQGLTAYTGLSQVLEPGWYAFAMVSGDTIQTRYVKGTDPMLQGNFDVSTTTVVAVNYYSATGTGMVAGGITDPGDYSDLTEVTSATDFTVWNPMLMRFNLNPKVPA